MSVQPELRPGSARVRVVIPGDGDVGGIAPGVGVVFKIKPADTGRALAIVEPTFAVGAIVPHHVHTHEDGSDHARGRLGVPGFYFLALDPNCTAPPARTALLATVRRAPIPPSRSRDPR